MWSLLYSRTARSNDSSSLLLHGPGWSRGTAPDTAATDAAEDDGEDGDEKAEEKHANDNASYLPNGEVCEWSKRNI